jgi:hypothetical protein
MKIEVNLGDQRARTITEEPVREFVRSVITLLMNVTNANATAAGFWDPPAEVAGLVELRGRLASTMHLDNVQPHLDQLDAAIRALSTPNYGEKIALMHSELSEAFEAHRHTPPGAEFPSDHISGFTGEEEEMADEVIRVFDVSRQRNLRLADAILAKMDFNATRPYKHGKTC